MKQITKVRKTVCTMANQLRKAGYSLKDAFKKAWQRVKLSMTIRAAGTTFEKGKRKGCSQEECYYLLPKESPASVDVSENPLPQEFSGNGGGGCQGCPYGRHSPCRHGRAAQTDQGTILVECGEMLRRGTPKMKDGKAVRDKNGKVVYEPYKIKVLNTINFNKSMHYNPFRYIRSEKDILKLVNTIIANTKGEGEKSSEDFWTKAERLLYCALIGYIYYEAPEEEQNLANACKAQAEELVLTELICC